MPGKHGPADPLPRFGDRRRVRIGLLGGSFNPAHEGHRQIAMNAMRRLGLQQVWLLVSPGNPLKSRAGMAAFPARLASAQRFADGRRIIATDLEARLGSNYSWRTIRILRTRFPRAQFVWLMGADILEQLPAWRRWTDLPAQLPLAVFPRPGYNLPALAGQAAMRYRFARLQPVAATQLACAAPPAWVFLPARQNPISATALRQAGKGA